MNSQSSIDFNRDYYESMVWASTFWLGYPVAKTPTDLWMYQEIIVAQRPDIVIETGTLFGGSALYMACILDLVGHGHVISIDNAPKPDLPVHPRISYVTGSSIAGDIMWLVSEAVPKDARTMVVLDSDHSREHVQHELGFYSRFVQPDGYLIVEDTNLNGHPVAKDFGPGPMEAVEEFLVDHPEFEVDQARERFGLTFNPLGYLRKRT